MDKNKTHEELPSILLRVTLSIIIASHGWHRLITGGYEPFGGWLESQGLPFGFVVALSITLIEVIGSIFLALGKHLLYLCGTYIIIYFTGLLMVHLQHGWFVVGSGSNGIEYSTLIIVALFCVAYPKLPVKLKPTP